MSPELLAVAPPPAAAATAATFRPAALPVTAAPADQGPSDRARAAGYAAGWAAGARAAAEAAAQQQQRFAAEHARAEATRDAAVADALDVLERTVAAVAARAVPVVDGLRRTVHEAALELTSALLGQELTPGPRSARALLGRALALPVEVGVHTVRMNPADLEQVRALLATSAGVALPDGVDLVADPTLAPGDAVSEYPAGYLDAQVSTALDRARRALLEGEA